MNEIMNERTEIINKIWDNIHDDNIFKSNINNNDVIYYYDEYCDVIRSTTGYCVLVEKFNNELTSEYIITLIENLKEKNIQYFNNILNNKSEHIKNIWNNIHFNKLPIFCWDDDTETPYFYDEKTDMIKSDNGFCVPVEKNTEELTEDYISNLIDKLKTIIVLYYRYNMRQELNCTLYKK